MLRLLKVIHTVSNCHVHQYIVEHESGMLDQLMVLCTLIIKLTIRPIYSHCTLKVYCYVAPGSAFLELLSTKKINRVMQCCLYLIRRYSTPTIIFLKLNYNV